MADEPTTLYRLYDANDTLLYVGISRRWIGRLSAHATSKDWWNDVAAIRRETFPSRKAALAAEAQAIRAEDPLYNIAGKGGNVLRFPKHQQAHDSRPVCSNCGRRIDVGVRDRGAQQSWHDDCAPPELLAGRPFFDPSVERFAIGEASGADYPP